MIEASSLVLLANVALDNRPKIVQTKCLKKREARTKTLKVTNLNGENHAEITDLKCMPISTLFKIFVEKFEDKKLHCLVYICKYEHKSCCNTRFIDIKKNRINRLEHLVQCHLLEHLTKTKTGSMIKLPKLFSMPERGIRSISETEPVVKLKQKLKYEEVEWGSEEKNIIQPATLIEEENKSSKATSIQERGIVEIDDNIKKRVRSKESNIKKSESRNTIDKSSCAEYSILRRVKFDHPYSNLSEPSSNVTPSSSNRCVFIPIEYRNVDVDNLYYLNGESSSELNSFMMYETLNQPMFMMNMGDEKLVAGELPLVGCEAEVTTEKAVNEVMTDECRPESDESYFPCSKCDIVLSSKQVLHSHMRNKHFDAARFKPYRVSPKNRISSTEPKIIKHKFEIVSEYRNNDLFEVVKENKGDANDKFVKRVDMSILKTALLKESNKKPVINISNIWNNINVQYV